MLLIHLFLRIPKAHGSLCYDVYLDAIWDKFMMEESPTIIDKRFSCIFWLTFRSGPFALLALKLSASNRKDN